MADRFHASSWQLKFRNAFRGLWLGVRGQSSFGVHLPAAAAVAAAAAVLRVSLAEWGLLVLCIAVVLASEFFNSALEALARAVDVEHNEQIAAALDIASAAVLVASGGAAIVGGMVFVYRLGLLLRWWT